VRVILASPLCVVLLAAGTAPPPTGTADTSTDTIKSLDRVEVTATPLPGTSVDARALPYIVQSASADDIAKTQAGNLVDFMTRRLGGVSSNEVQGSPFQTDITFRGFRASALPGAPQGLSVYLDGVRVNEPFADIVSWDMIPEAAIRSLSLMPGSNPLYGANTLGGALVLSTKSGATDPGLQGDLSLGSDALRRLDASYGASSGNGLHGLFATTLFEEDGWRDASGSRVGTLFTRFGRDGERSDWNLSLLHGRSRMIGNGLLPDLRYAEDAIEPSLYAADRRAIYTAPDLTRNRNNMVVFGFDHAFDDARTLHLQAHVRRGERRTVNGDVAGEYEAYVDDCGDGFDLVGQPLDEACGYTAGEGLALTTGVFNTTQMRQQARGVAANIENRAGPHTLTYGVLWDNSHVLYRQFEQAGDVDGQRQVSLQPGASRDFVSGVRGDTRTFSVLASDLWQVGPRTHLSGSLRWNHMVVANSILAAGGAAEPERFTYARANPAVGVTHGVGAVTWHVGLAQNNRAPTAIELGCADPAMPCRLPTGLQADPRLEEVVSRTGDVGLRWNPSATRAFSVSLYRADNRNDILFLRAPHTQQGYFDNVGRTRYQGADVLYSDDSGPLAWYTGYSYLDASYRSTGQLLAGERIVDIRPGTRIAGLPRHNLKAGFEWTMHASLAIGGDLQASSSRTSNGNEDGLVDDADDGGAALERDASTAGFALVNLHAAWMINPRLSLYARVSNVFDRRYETYGAIAEDMFPDGALAQPARTPAEDATARFVAPGAPRRYQLGVRWRF
jgi:outer membrane receptor protein involved in Fe transport